MRYTGDKHEHGKKPNLHRQHTVHLSNSFISTLISKLYVPGLFKDSNPSTIRLILREGGVV